MTESEQIWHDAYDTVVVGSGAGALAGAFAAAQAGLETAVVERTPLLGGTSAYSGAACWLPGSQVHERADRADSTGDARAYLHALLGKDTAHRQEAFLSHAPELVQLLESSGEVEFAWQPFPDYTAAPGRAPVGRSLVARDLATSRLGHLASLVRPPVEQDRRGDGHPEDWLSAGRALIGRLLLALTATGRGTVHTRTRVTRLVVEGERVVGVVATTPQGPVRIRARRGVLLAAGGFEGNAGMRADHGVGGRAAWSMAPRGANGGDAIRAAGELGAATDLLEEAWWCPALQQPDGGAGFLLGLRGGLMVDAAGRRFANESLPYDRMGRAMAAVASGPAGRIPAYMIFDSRFGGQLPAISVPPSRPEEHLAAGTWLRADSVGELATRIGIDPGELSSTVERFAGYAATGVDAEFRRGEDPFDRFFAAGEGPNPCLVPLDHPPYYAARVVLGDLGTKGGLRTDTGARVLRGDDSVLPGLYATGNTAASLTGSVYPAPGIPIGTAMVFGSLAARDMAAAAPANQSGEGTGL